MANDNPSKDDPQAMIAQVQSIEQALHMQSTQRATLQAQLHELENATSELEGAKESYRIIGNVMVKTDATKLKAEFDTKKESLKHRISTFERNEERLRSELKKMQEQVLRG